jgi:hypothetical protein
MISDVTLSINTHFDRAQKRPGSTTIEADLLDRVPDLCLMEGDEELGTGDDGEEEEHFDV